LKYIAVLVATQRRLSQRSVGPMCERRERTFSSVSS